MFSLVKKERKKERSIQDRNVMTEINKQHKGDGDAFNLTGIAGA